MVADLGYDFALALRRRRHADDPGRRAVPRRSTWPASSSRHPRGLGRDEPQPPRPRARRRCSTGRVQRLSVRRAELRRPAAAPDGPLRQVRFAARRSSSASRSMAGKFHSFNVDMIFNFPSQTEEILLRDIELVKATGANQTTFYPLMASPLRRTRARRDGRARSTSTARRATTDARRRSARTGVRARERVDVLARPRRDDRRVHRRLPRVRRHRLRRAVVPRRHASTANTFSLRRVQRARSQRAGWPSSSRAGRYGLRARMRYRFVTDLFGLRLDKKRFRRDFGVPVELGLRRRDRVHDGWSAAIATNTRRGDHAHAARAATCCS